MDMNTFLQALRGLNPRLYTPPLLESLPGYDQPGSVPNDNGHYFFDIVFPEIVDVSERHERYERPLEEALQAAKIGHVDGGGTAFIGYSEVFVVATDAMRCLETIVAVLVDCDPPIGTKIVYDIEDNEYAILEYTGDSWRFIHRDAS
jgi:hypothetical protein